ncbi:MAG: hypothetical protein LBQ89_07990 [Treponema sp.]|jgi:hypothetical protein|nr:hypothetical protein [Treponema sp.]
MSDKNMTAEEIFTLIDNQSVNKETGIGLIENYGFRKQREFINNLQKDTPGYTGEIEGIIDRLNTELDKMLNAIIGVEK